jgi:hypothetical protein
MYKIKGAEKAVRKGMNDQVEIIKKNKRKRVGSAS